MSVFHRADERAARPYPKFFLPPDRPRAHPARMVFYLIKLLVSAGLIVLVSEIVVKRTGFLGGLIASLPLVSLLAIGWIWFETHDAVKIADFSRSVFWFVLPSLLFFIALPWFLPRLGFYP